MPASPASASPAPILNPEAQRAIAASAVAARGYISGLGLDKQLLLGGGILAVLGTFLPFVSAPLPIGSISLIRLGVPGAFLLLLAAALAGAPFLLQPSRRIALAGFGVCIIVLSNLLVALTGIAAAQFVTSMLQGAAGSMFGGATAGAGGASFGPGLGFYSTLIGFVVLFVAYVRGVSE